jgi:D-aminoacyl-tRNA deacylase
MIALLQRVRNSRVEVNEVVVGQIGTGLLVMLAVERSDTEAEADRMVDRLLGYRVFEDPAGRMNLSLVDTGGDLLLVPQFTLAADTSKGMRPSFTGAAAPGLGRTLFDHVAQRARESLGERVATGRFGANMQVSLTNDGPVTFWLRTSGLAGRA